MKTMIWTRRAGTVVLLLCLSGGLGSVAIGRAVAAGTHVRSSHGVALDRPALPQTSWRAWPAGLAPLVRRALMRRRPTASGNTTWNEQAQLNAPGTLHGRFGISVAVVSGTALIGTNANTAYVFVRSGTTWSQQATLTPPGSPTGYTGFGSSVSLSGTTAIIGAPNQNNKTGAAYVYVRHGTTWSLQARLLAPTPAANSYFGFTVAVYANTAMVEQASATTQGSVSVFVRSGTTWSFVQQLTASDGAPGDYFGDSMATNGTMALIGASGQNGNTGAAYVFVNDGTTWTQTQEITAADGAPNSYFGSVALSGPLAAIGALGRNEVYTYVRSGSGITTTYALQSEFAGPDGGGFGNSVALSGGTLLVGAPDAYTTDYGLSGAAYVYALSGGTWVQQAELTGPGTSMNSLFGYPVSLSGGTALIGAYGYQGQKGAAYVFVRG